MNIPLSEFEHIIDETIFRRGVSYFQNGCVTDFSEILQGEYKSNVSGTDEYSVNIKIEKNIIVYHHCDCPYDMGPVCKHIVASICYLQQDELNFNQENTSLQKKKKQISAKQQINVILDKVSHSEIKNFIREQSKIDKQFKNLFLAKFMNLHANHSKEMYQSKIRLVINAFTDRDGFISWDKMKYLEREIEQIIVISEQQFESKHYINTFYICTALMEEMIEAMQCGDDEWILGSIIDYSYEMLYKIALEDLYEEIRIEFFRYCIRTFEKRLFDGWDWHIGMLQIAYRLIHNENEADIIIKCLDTLERGLEQESALSLALDIITQYKKVEQVQKFIEKNITNASIRNSEIAKAIEDKNFERAITLARDGIAYDSTHKPKLLRDWYNYLLQIAQIKNDSPKIIECARFLFIDNFKHNKDYYAILKQNIAPNEWSGFVETIITEFIPKGNWTYAPLVRHIFIKEQWWDRLFLMVKENISLPNIENNEKYLSKDYAQALIQLYSDILVYYVENNTKREHYQTACRYLYRMRNLGGNEKANELIEYFRNTYPRRKALLDELNSV